MSSIRGIAEDIARRGVPYSWLNNEDEYRSALNWFANEIEQSLRNRDERAAKIVNDARTEGHVDLRSLVTLILADD